jgi:hypothetical protein
LRNIKFHSRDPGKRDGRAYPKWTAWPGQWAGRMGSRIFAIYFWGKGERERVNLVYICKTTIG